MRIEAEIEAEIKTLQSQLPRVRKRGLLGSNVDAIKAQIRVLSQHMRRGDIYVDYGDDEADDYADNVFDAAIEAYDWMNGKSQESLSADWESLCEGNE